MDSGSLIELKTFKQIISLISLEEYDKVAHTLLIIKKLNEKIYIEYMYVIINLLNLNIDKIILMTENIYGIKPKEVCTENEEIIIKKDYNKFIKKLAMMPTIGEKVINMLKQMDKSKK